MPSITLDRLNNTETLVTVYDANPPTRATVVLIVEGNDDKQIWARWFEHGVSTGSVKFATPKSYGGDADGCAAVIRVVSSGQGSGIPIYGIVDRDSLVKDYRSAFFEIDDRTFESLNPHVPNVRVLTHWEIENYLVELTMLQALFSDRKGDDDAAVQNLAQLVREVLEAVLLFTATNIALSDLGLRPFPSGWNLVATLTRADMLRELDRDVFPAKVDEGTRASFIQHRESIESSLRRFGEEKDPASHEFVSRALRAVDGKALLGRIIKALHCQIDEAVAKRTLARYMSQSVPVELTDHINFFIRRASSAQ